MRAQVETCDAVFVLCNKAPASAKQEDLQTVMTILAIGQYIQVRGATAWLWRCRLPVNSFASQQDAYTVHADMPCFPLSCSAAQAKEKARLKVGPKPLMQRLREGFRGFMKHFHKVQLCAWHAGSCQHTVSWCLCRAAANPAPA